MGQQVKFLSTPSGWRATGAKNCGVPGIGFLSTPSGWRATFQCLLLMPKIGNFYPRPPGGGRQRSGYILIRLIRHFYPRPPGGGRREAFAQALRHVHFYPRPPGGGRRNAGAVGDALNEISIHALRVEGDDKKAGGTYRELRDFYPRPPGGGRRFASMQSSSMSIFLSTPSGWRATHHGPLPLRD